MAKLAWDQLGAREYETGVSKGVLYLPNAQGVYDDGVAWNGLTTVTEAPSGAESNPQYADNIKYIDLKSAEEFGATIEAFTYPDEFAQCDGTAIVYGVALGQQSRKPFGFSYQTLKGNDLQGTDFGYKIHLVYGATAAPSEKAFTTVNDSPEALTFSWELTTSAVEVGVVGGVAYKPSASLTIDSTLVSASALQALESALYGSAGQDPRLPTPREVLEFFAGTQTAVDLSTSANQPSYNSTSHVVTIPTVTGVTWKVNGVTKPSGAQPAMTTGQKSVVTAHPSAGYYLTAESDDDWVYSY